MAGRVNHYGDVWSFDAVAYRNYERGRHKSDNVTERHKLAKIMLKAIDVFLTDRQKYIFVEHTIHHRKMRDIAKELGVNPSTVTRTYQVALNTLEKVAACFEGV